MLQPSTPELLRHLEKYTCKRFNAVQSSKGEAEKDVEVESFFGDTPLIGLIRHGFSGCNRRHECGIKSMMECEAKNDREFNNTHRPYIPL